MTTRRSLLLGGAAFIAAPAIVRLGSIMPVKAWGKRVLLSERIGNGLVWIDHMTGDLRVEIASGTPDGWIVIPPACEEAFLRSYLGRRAPSVERNLRILHHLRAAHPEMRGLTVL